MVVVVVEGQASWRPRTDAGLGTKRCGSSTRSNEPTKVNKEIEAKHSVLVESWMCARRVGVETWRILEGNVWYGKGRSIGVVFRYVPGVASRATCSWLLGADGRVARGMVRRRMESWWCWQTMLSKCPHTLGSLTRLDGMSGGNDFRRRGIDGGESPWLRRGKTE